MFGFSDAKRSFPTYVVNISVCRHSLLKKKLAIIRKQGRVRNIMFTRTLFSSFCIRIHLPKRFHDATAHKIRFDKLYVRPCVRCFWDAARIDSVHRDKNTYVCTLNIERSSIIPINLRWKPLYDGDPPYAAARWTRDRTLKRLHVLAHFPFLSTFLLYSCIWLGLCYLARDISRK